MFLVDVDRQDLGRRQGIGDEDRRVVVPRDDVDLLAAQLRDDGLDPCAALAHRGADRIEPFLARRDGDLRSAARFAGDGLDLDRAVVDLRDLELEQPLEEALVRPRHEDLRTLRGATDLEHVGLDVLADPVVLDGRLLGRGEDRLDVLADVEDDRPRLDAVDRARDELALAVGELVEDDVPLGLAEALQDHLLGGLRADPAEDVPVELLDLDEVADGRVRLVCARLLDGELGQRVLDHRHNRPGPKDPDLAGLGIDPDVDVLIARDPPVGGLDGLLDGPDELLAGNLLFGVQLEEGTDEISTHDAASDKKSDAITELPVRKKTWGSPTSRSGRSVQRSIHAEAWTLKRDRSCQASAGPQLPFGSARLGGVSWPVGDRLQPHVGGRRGRPE